MIEQLQSLMKALEAGSYNAQPTGLDWNEAVKTFADLPVVGAQGETRMVLDTQEIRFWTGEIWAVVSNAASIPPKEEPKPRQRHIHDPYRYYFGDETFTHHK